MSGANPFKFVMLPPQSETTRDWAKRLAEVVPEARVIVAEDAETAGREIVDAEAAFGWLGSDHSRPTSCFDARASFAPVAIL